MTDTTRPAELSEASKALLDETYRGWRTSASSWWRGQAAQLEARLREIEAQAVTAYKESLAKSGRTIMQLATVRRDVAKAKDAAAQTAALRDENERNMENSLRQLARAKRAEAQTATAVEALERVMGLVRDEDQFGSSWDNALALLNDLSAAAKQHDEAVAERATEAERERWERAARGALTDVAYSELQMARALTTEEAESAGEGL